MLEDDLDPPLPLSASNPETPRYPQLNSAVRKGPVPS